MWTCILGTAQEPKSQILFVGARFRFHDEGARKFAVDGYSQGLCTSHTALGLLSFELSHVTRFSIDHESNSMFFSNLCQFASVPASPRVSTILMASILFDISIIASHLWALSPSRPVSESHNWHAIALGRTSTHDGGQWPNRPLL
jgi:hypothetical protein